MYQLIKPNPQGKKKSDFKRVKGIVNKALSSENGKQISDPANYMGVGFIKGKNKLPKSLVNRLRDSAQARAFQRDIDNYSAELKKDYKLARERAKAQEARKRYFLNSTPEQRAYDAIKKFKNK